MSSPEEVETKDTLLAAETKTTPDKDNNNTDAVKEKATAAKKGTPEKTLALPKSNSKKQPAVTKTNLSVQKNKNWM